MKAHLIISLLIHLTVTISPHPPPHCNHSPHLIETPTGTSPYHQPHLNTKTPTSPSPLFPTPNQRQQGSGRRCHHSYSELSGYPHPASPGNNNTTIPTITGEGTRSIRKAELEPQRGCCKECLDSSQWRLYSRCIHNEKIKQWKFLAIKIKDGGQREALLGTTFSREKIYADNNMTGSQAGKHDLKISGRRPFEEFWVYNMMAGS